MADTGIGTSIAFGTMAWTPAMLNITPEAITRETLRTSNLSTTGAHAKMPHDLHDVTGFAIRGQFDPDDWPDYDAASETITITWPDANTTAFTGWMDSFTPGAANMDGLMEFEGHIAVTGDLSNS